jgi:phenylpropionate dioxygenase-like ring-hydroxylating dioxygenase large terminal subunit
MGPSYRYPFGPYPDGWYVVTAAADLAPGAVVPLEYFGRELVAFRTEAGDAVVADAHCPHMGAHLGYGGAVVGDTVRCPFHAWRFDTAGLCVEVPYSTSGQVPRVCLTTHPVVEVNGLVHVWASGAGRAPSWRPRERPEYGAPGWLGYETIGWRIRMHVQELAENVPDMAHFATVHGVGVEGVGLRALAEVDGHVYRQQSQVQVDGEYQTFTEQEAEGLGLVWLHSMDSRVCFVTATTPIDDETCELRLMFLVHQPNGDGPDGDGPGLTAANRAMVDAIAENTSRDVPIWEHKKYVEKAPLVADDGPILMLRRWARQFHG